jgi:hypothetical protein
MTVGALLQLEYGNADRMSFLTLNPQITHFKSVYKKYTNFATQFITNQPTTSRPLSFDIDTTISFKIPRDGDAIRDMYLTLELPDIYSDSNYQFQWIKRIGEYIVKDVSIQIDTNQSVDKHYAEWFHAYSELNYDEGKKKGYYEMIGNVPELYDPSNAPGNNGQYPSTSYAPSIINRKIYLPLIFWFNKFASMSFPLVSIQQTVINLTFTFRKLQGLYTVVDYSGAPNNGTGYRVQPSKSNHYIGNFLKPINTQKSTLDVNPRLEINNVFLDNEERKRFALASHEYLITQLQRIYEPSKSSAGIKLDLKDINKPVTELVFMIRRSDMEDVNDWSNFTNWNVSNIPPYSNGYSNPYGLPLNINSNNIEYYKTKNILKSAVIRIQTQEITTGDVVNNDTLAKIDGKDSVFYNKMQNFNANQNIPSEGIYTYSFSLDNSSLQPIGAVNMSSISNKDILLNLSDINPNGGYNYPSLPTYQYNIYVFAVNYEILKIMAGKVGPIYAN